MKKIIIDPENWRDLPGYRRNVLLTSADLNSPGARMQIVTVQPGAHIAPHYHKTSTEVYIVQKGQCTLRVNGQETILIPGSMLVMEPGDVHELSNHGREPFQLLVFKTNAGPDDTYWTAES